MIVRDPIVSRLRPIEIGLGTRQARTLYRLFIGQAVIVLPRGVVGGQRAVIGGLGEGYVAGIRFHGLAVSQLLQQVGLFGLGHFRLQNGRIECCQDIALLHLIADLYFHFPHRARRIT